MRDKCIYSHRLRVESQLDYFSCNKTPYLKHLCGNNDRLSSNVTFRNHHLLREEYLTSGNFDTQITASDHDTISLLEDLIEVFDASFVLDFDDDFNIRTVWAENLADMLDVVCSSNKRRKDHVNTVLDTKLEIFFVLLRQSWKIYIGLRKIDTLAGRECPIVENTDMDVRTINGKDKQGQDTYQSMVERISLSRYFKHAYHRPRRSVFRVLSLWVSLPMIPIIFCYGGMERKY